MSRWQDVSLKDIALIGDGAHASLKRVDKGILYLTSKNFKPDGIYLNVVDYISEETYHKYFKNDSKSLTKPKNGDILLSIIGTIGAPYLVKKDDEFGLSSSVSIIRPKEIDSKYLYYWIKSPMFQGAVDQIKSGVAQSFLSLPMIGSLPVNCPESYATQKKIAKILSNYDDLIENNLKRIKLLEESARLTYEEWFLRFRIDGKKLDIDPESRLPFGWEWKLLNSVCKEISSGGTPSRANKKYWDSDDYDWVTTKELKDGYIYNTKEKISSLGLEKSSAKLYPKGTIVMAIYASPTLGRLGVITKESCFNQAAVGFIIDENFISNEFLYCKLIDERTGLNALAIGAAQQNINVAKVKSYEVAIPNFELIEKFTYIVKPIFNEIENLGHQNQLLKEARDILLPRLMTGMIDTDKLKVAV